MIDIDEEQTLSINRGNSGTISLKIPLSYGSFYQFEIGDTITFRIFEKNGYDKVIKLEKKYEISKESDKVNIVLEKEDTLFADIMNKPQTYWYEVVLNDEKTIVGYDEDGAKKIIINPAGEGGGI